MVVSEMERERRAWGRRRRENAPGGRQHDHRVKVTPEEEGALRVRADALGVTIPRLLVESALAGGAEAVRDQQAEDQFRREMRVELARLRRGLGAVGVNINQIARAANVTGETEAELSGAVAHLRTVLTRHEDFYRQWGSEPR